MAAKHSAGTYAPKGMDVDFAPFHEADYDALAKAVVPTEIKVTRARFSEIVVKLNKAARRWKVYCDIDPAPTDKQERDYVVKISKAAEKLASLLGATFEEDDSETAVTLHDPRDMASVEVPDDQGRTDHTQEAGGTLPDGFPNDPTADGAWSVPLVLDRVLPHFHRHYLGEGPEYRHFRIPEEALEELAIMVQALVAGAADRLDELDEADGEVFREAKPFDGKLRGGMEISLGGARSPNHALFLDLIPIYKELISPKIGRSRTSPSETGRGQPGNEPSGPAVKFYTFVYDRMGAASKGRSDETILGWIEDWMTEQGTKP